MISGRSYRGAGQKQADLKPANGLRIDVLGDIDGGWAACLSCRNSPFSLFVFARSEATKQSISLQVRMDCFASLAMTTFSAPTRATHARKASFE